jgi:hypothetical protein
LHAGEVARQKCGGIKPQAGEGLALEHAPLVGELDVFTIAQVEPAFEFGARVRRSPC